jgi:hypothetical protein
MDDTVLRDILVFPSGLGSTSTRLGQQRSRDQSRPPIRRGSWALVHRHGHHSQSRRASGVRAVHTCSDEAWRPLEPKRAGGLDADIVVLDADPATDVRNFAKVAYTIRAGKIIYSGSKKSQ